MSEDRGGLVKVGHDGVTLEQARKDIAALIAEYGADAQAMGSIRARIHIMAGKHPGVFDSRMTRWPANPAEFRKPSPRKSQ